MFDLVPFAGAGGKVNDCDPQAGLVGQFLQFEQLESLLLYAK